MKNLLLSLCLTVSTIPVLWAQTLDELSGSAKKERTAIPMSKGSRFLGLNGAGGIGRGHISEIDTWSATGQAGYFIADRWVAGLQLSYGSFHFVDKLAGTASYIPQPAWKKNDRYFSPEIFTRYYFTPWKVKPFVQLSGGWNFQTRDSAYLSGENTQVSTSNFTAKAALGVSFKLGKRMGLDLMYNRSLLSKPQLGDYNGFRLGLTFIIGK